MALKENYKDDILDTSQNVKRKYQMENNGDGTVSFTDVTEYTQQGDSFGSGDINATNSKVNTIDSAVTTLNANLDGFKFYPTGTGIVGLIADDSAYTDEDGNYVVWGTATANQLVEDNPNTYKSVPSEEDTRGLVGEDTAKSFGGGSSMNIKESSLYHRVPIGSQYLVTIDFFNTNPIVGYKAISVQNSSGGLSGNGEYIGVAQTSGGTAFIARKKGKFKVYRAYISNTSTSQENGYVLIDTVDANVGDTVYTFGYPGVTQKWYCTVE